MSERVSAVPVKRRGATSTYQDRAPELERRIPPTPPWELEQALARVLQGALPEALLEGDLEGAVLRKTT